MHEKYSLWKYYNSQKSQKVWTMKNTYFLKV